MVNESILQSKCSDKNPQKKSNGEMTSVPEHTVLDVRVLVFSWMLDLRLLEWLE
jgi:hypothetical protein